MENKIINVIAELLKKADKDAGERGITDYNDAITENAKFLVSRGVTVRRKGKWKKSYSCGEHYECTVCKYMVRAPRAYFCPQCGSDMKGG